MEETHHLGGDALASVVVRESLVPLAQPGMRDGSTRHNRLIIPEEIGRAFKVGTEVAKRNPQTCDLLNCLLGCHELRSVSSRLDSGLLLRKPFDRGLIYEMKDACHGSACRKVMVKVGVFISGRDHWLALRRRSICWNLLLNLSIYRAFPTVLLIR